MAELRQAAKDLLCEPDYPGLETVAFVLSAPDWAIHLAQPACDKDYPHLIADCGLFFEDE